MQNPTRNRANKIQRLMGKALSNDEVGKLVGGKAKFVIYPDLHKYQSIDEVLGPHEACYILYESSKNYGHYVCLIKQGGGKLEFFDPYAFKPDAELKFIPEYFRQESNQTYPHLCYLMYNSPYKVEYNHTQLQSKASDVSTCGRHVACRINHRSMPLKEYVKKLTSFKGLTPDQAVTLMTANV